MINNHNIFRFVQSAIAASALLISSSALALNPGIGSGPLGDYTKTGPHAVISEAGGTECTVIRPASLQENHPVILWGNGTGASVGIYRSGLEHWASWGYVVVAANTSNAGTAVEMIECLDEVSDSAIASNLDLSKVGASGHSQGGGGAIMAGRDSRVITTAPLQPFTLALGHQVTSQSTQIGPMLQLSGSADFIAGPKTNQQPVYDNVNVPIFWATLKGASHFEPIGNMGDYLGITTAWWEYQLKGNTDAADLFAGDCEVCDLDDWAVQRKGF